MQIDFVGERTIEISKDQTILAASLNAGIPHFHACGGRAKCSTCRILVLEGEDNLSKANKKESKLLERIGVTSTVRLACQTRIEKEPVKVERIIKDEYDFQLNIMRHDQNSKKFDFKSMGEEKYLVLFFLDIRNFTPFVETHLPFDVMYLTRKLFRIFYDVISRFKGQIIETAGDGLYAVFGRASSIRKATESAISAGQAILDELDALNQNYLKIYFRREIEIGIGIHSGRVIVGEFNIGDQLKTTVMGLAVNVASRIQNCTKEFNNSFLVSDEVLRHLAPLPEFENYEVDLKGVSTRIKLHLLGRSYKKIPVSNPEI